MVVKDNYGAYFVSQYNALTSVNVNSEYKNVEVKEADKDKEGTTFFKKIGNAIYAGASAMWDGITGFLNAPFGMLMGVAAIAAIGVGGVVVIKTLNNKKGGTE